MSSSSSDDSLDFSSSNFNPLKALYSPKVKLPDPKAQIQDNITKFVCAEGGITIKGIKTKKVVTIDSENAPSTSTRRFEPHQEPIRRKQREVKNVLTRMNSVEGPLALVKDLMERRIRVKVVTRNMAAVRGYCVGFIVAFDKHLNLAMEDVTEVWTRKKRMKTPALGEALDVTETKLKVHISVPRIVVRKTKRKLEECERHVNQLLLRGEHIVIISALI